jgi:hypothetical protein
MSLFNSFKTLMAASLLLMTPSLLPALTVMNDSGDTVTAGQTYTMSGFKILANIQTGGTWGGNTIISNPSINPQNPVAAINNNGDIIVIWADDDAFSSSKALYASICTGGVWSAVSLLSEPVDEYLLDKYSVHMADNGTVVVSYESYRYSDYSSVTRVIYSSTLGTWGTPVTLF